MNDVENRFYKLLNSYNDLEYGSHKGSKMSSFFAFLFLFVLGLFLDIFLIIEAIVENISVFYELVIIFLLPSIIPLIFYIFENKKSNKLLKELIDLRQNNKILANSKILLEDYFKDVISSEYTFDK